jgi:MarR family transcriptional regulator, temperature-dependent positive regulator of motility
VTATNDNSPEARFAHEHGSSFEFTVRHIDRTCRRIVLGRHAARSLSEWTQRFELSESEFQLLWCLRSATGDGLDQTTLARKLANSPAQISGTVERARAKGWIAQESAPGDRRRHLWRLTGDGRVLITQMVQAATMLRRAPITECDVSSREAAA